MNALGNKSPFNNPETSVGEPQSTPQHVNDTASINTFEDKPKDWSTIPYPPPWHLQTMRLNIRPFHINDTPRLAQLANDSEISASMTDRFPHPYTTKAAEAFINHISSALHSSDRTNDTQNSTAPPPICHFAIILRTDQHDNVLPDGGLLVGGIGVDQQSDVFRRGAELGYWLAREHWGHGYATEAAHEFVEWLFDLDNGMTGVEGESLLRISAGVFGGNERSVRVLERVGFVVEATMSDAVWKRGQVRDLVLMALTRRQREMRAAVRTVQG